MTIEFMRKFVAEVEPQPVSYLGPKHTCESVIRELIQGLENGSIVLDRDWFIRENAVALMADRDVKITRLREQVRRLIETRDSLKQELRRARGLPPKKK